MKKIYNIILLLLCAVALNAQTVDRSIRPLAAPAKEINIKDAATFTLSNGLKVFVVEDHRAPTVYYSLQLDVKPALEGNKAGLQELFGGVVGTATKSLTKEQLNKEIDLIGANINIGARGGFGSGLKKYETRLLELLSDMILNPAFLQEELDLNMNQLKSGLQFISGDPASISERISSALVYGKNYPDGELVTQETVNNIALGDLETFYHTYFAPNVTRLVVVGAVTEAQARENAQKYFGHWQRKEVPVAVYTIPQAPDRTHVAMHNRDKAVQSIVGLTYPIDFKPGAPDASAANIANHILGGGASGRLFQNLRETYGYTYGTYSSLRSGELVGSFGITSGRRAGTSVRAAVTDSALVQIIYEMDRMTNTPVSEEDLRAAKAYLAGDFGRSLQSPSTIAGFAVNIDKYNLPKDYYKNHLKRLDAVTIADVQAAAQKYFKPKNGWIVVVGDKAHADLLAPFSADNTVQFYDMNANPVAAPETIIADISAVQIINNYVQAIGGFGAIAQVADYKMTGTINAMGQNLEITKMFKTPHYSLSTMGMGGMVIQKMVFDGETYTVSGMGGSQVFEEGDDEFESAKAEAAVCPEMNLMRNGYVLTVKGIEKIDNADVYVMDAEKGAIESTYYFDAKTNLLIRQSIAVETPQGVVQTISDYSDFRSVGGVLFPFKIVQRIPSMNMEMTTTIINIQVNSGLTAADFK